MDPLSDYKACTTITTEGGITRINCKLGLWGVNSPCYMTAQQEAQNYFRQYKSDGEYSEIIGGKTPVEILRGDL